MLTPITIRQGIDLSGLSPPQATSLESVVRRLRLEPLPSPYFRFA